MTVTYCRGCATDVHITHDDADCPANDADLRTPPDLRASRVAAQEGE
jgi:hypothetical protein